MPDLNDVSAGFRFDDEVIAKALENIYRKEFNPKTDIEPNLFRETWRAFNQASNEGFSQAHFNPIDAFADEIRYNNAVFSAFRVHRQQNDMAARLLDENGKLKSFSQWKKEVLPIADHYNKTWFKTEYDTAVIRAHRAAEWKQFEAEADVLPNLEWIETTSPNPGADHKIFWGTIKPINDVFWSQHRPGDRWNCKCSLRQTDKEPTDAPTVQDGKDMPASGLENNPADDGKLFSDQHPYRAEAYSGAKKATDNFLKREIADTRIKKVKSFKNGGTYSEFASVDKKQSDYKLVRNVGTEFARMGKQATALPKLHFKSEGYKQIYAALAGTKYFRKNPDLLVNGKFFEVEGFVPPLSRTKTKNMLRNGLKQSDNVVLNNTKGTSDRYIRRLIFDHVKAGNEVNEVWLYEKGALRLFYKNTAGK